MPHFDVTLDAEADGGRIVKLASEALELNFRATVEELRRLGEVRSASWNERRSLQVGRVAGTTAFWVSDDVTATMLIGSDDETWDVAVTVPLEVVDEIVRLASEET